MDLPDTIVIHILSYTDYDTIKSYREVNKSFIDNNINYIFIKMRPSHLFLKYNNSNSNNKINFDEFKDIWNMIKYNHIFDNDLMKVIKRYDAFKKNVLYQLVICNIFKNNDYNSTLMIIQGIFLSNYNKVSLKNAFNYRKN